MKRVLSAFLSLILVFSCVAVSSAASFADAANHWASTAIDYMVGKNILNGYEDGSFRPDRTVTRAEYIKMLDETFGLTATTAISYSDVKSTDWFQPYVAKAAAQGYLLNYGSALNPSGALTRQEAAALLVRYLDLDSANMADPSTYPDYTSIKSAYRDYVMMATAEGLFQGYAEDGTFRPDTPLTRAQALTILSRAAGTIYKTSTTGTEAGAAAGNGVITQSGITVTNAQIPGRLIISEGVSGGTITLSGCTIGELEIRGTASVILSDTTVETLAVDSATSGFTAAISLISGSSVDTAVLETAAEIDLASRTSVDMLTVGKDARRCAVTGSGTLKKVDIQASGFTADKVPSTYEIASGITASFNGKSYSGSSATAGNTGFTVAPSTYASTSVCYLTATPAAAGTLYYYYTTSSVAPTTTTFDSYYSAASIKSSYTVSSGASRDVNIGNTVSVGTYPYVVVMLRDSSLNSYNPVVVPNKASTGFSVAPAVTTSGSYHYLSYTPVTGGTIYYYYTNSASALTISAFNSAYNSNSTSFKGTLNVTAGQSASNPTLQASRVSAYGYLAVILEDVNGAQYQPVVLSVSASTGFGTGGADSAKCSVSDDGIALTYTPSTSGTLQYYFAASGTVPSSAQFDVNFAAAASGLAASRSVTASRSFTVTIADENTAYSYPYLVLRLTSGTTKYDPVVISASGISVDINGTGFAAVPTVSTANGYYNVTLRTSYSATVYYYLTNSTSVPSASVFNVNYNNAVSALLSTKTGGTLMTNGVGTSTLQTVLRTTGTGDFRYMALMVTVNNGQSYKPLVVPLPGSGSDTLSSDDIFVSGPVYNIYNLIDHQIDFTPRYSGRVMYFYTDDPEIGSTDDIIAQILFGDSSEFSLSGYTEVTAGRITRISVNADVFPMYAVLIFVDESGNVYDPVIMTSDGASSSSTTDSGFNGTPTVKMESATAIPTVTYSTSISGTIYYYFTNSTYAPSTYNDFLTMYNSTAMSSYRGAITVGYGSGTQLMSTNASVSSFNYAVLMLQVDNASTGGYRKPVLVRINATSSSSSLFTTAFSGTPYISGSTLYFTPTMTGTLYYSYTDTDSLMDWMEPVSALSSMGAISGTTASLSYSMMSSLICQAGYGNSKTVSSYYGYQQNMTIYLAKNTGYLAVWMVSYDGNQISQPVFIDLTGKTVNNGYNSGTGSGYNGIFGLEGMNGFLYTPTYTTAYDHSANAYVGEISFMTSSTMVVRYFYTNDTASTMSSANFKTGFDAASSLNSSYAGSFFASSDSQQIITVPQYNSYIYKYVWICLTDVGTQAVYNPVRVQIN